MTCLFRFLRLPDAFYKKPVQAYRTHQAVQTLGSTGTLAKFVAAARANPTTPAEIDAKMRVDIDKWGKVIAKANIPQL